MEEAEAAPVGLQAAAQIVPAGDRVHRLVGDELLEHDRRGAPLDAPQVEEAAVEPRAQQVQQVGVDCTPLRLAREAVEHVRAQRHQRRGAARRHVEAPEQFLARRFGDVLEALQVLRRGIGVVGLRGRQDRCRIGREIAGERVDERVARRRIERAHRIERDDRRGSARRLAAFADQRAAARQRVAGGTRPPGGRAACTSRRGALEKVADGADQVAAQVTDQAADQAAALPGGEPRAASEPCTLAMSSWYLSSTPSVLLTVSGSSTTESSASSARDHSMVSATPGSL